MIIKFVFCCIFGLSIIFKVEFDFNKLVKFFFGKIILFILFIMFDKFLI